MSGVLFEVERERFGLPLAAVEGVFRGAWPVRLPRPPFGCIGGVDVHGQVLPLLDMGALLGLRRTLRHEEWAERLVSAHYLTVRVGEVALALCVDRVLDVSEAPNVVVLDPESLVGKGRRRLLARAAAEARR